MRTCEFGVNLNNREPLLAQEYSVADLLGLSQQVEELGFASVWVGDSLLARPRHDPLTLLAAISQRTRRVKLGTASLVTAMRNPLFLALEWATLDHLSDGRTILGACMGNIEEGVKREFAALGLDYGRRAERFEETLAVIRALWTKGTVSFKGTHFEYDDVQFYSGTEIAPLQPLQTPPPMWIVSNPRIIVGKQAEAKTAKVIGRAAKRIAQYGDGWLTCCRARHPEEYREQLAHIFAAADDIGRDRSEFTTAYQVTMTIGDSREEAGARIDDYINRYYPELSKVIDLGEWGPVGTPDDIHEWITTFADSGVNHFICRFGAVDQDDQVRRFARDVLPAFTG